MPNGGHESLIQEHGVVGGLIVALLTALGLLRKKPAQNGEHAKPVRQIMDELNHKTLERIENRVDETRDFMLLTSQTLENQTDILKKQNELLSSLTDLVKNQAVMTESLVKSLERRGAADA